MVAKPSKDDDYAVIRAGSHHWDLIKNRVSDRYRHSSMQDEDYRAMLSVHTMWAITYRDRVVAVFGIFKWVRGVWEAIFISTDSVIQHKRKIIREIRKWLRNAPQYAPGLRRLEARVDLKYPEREAFVRFFGFQKEGILRQYGDDKHDYALYSYIF